MSISVSIKMTAKQVGALYMKAIKLEDKVEELEAINKEMYEMLGRLKTSHQNLIELDHIPYYLYGETNEIINEIENLLAKARG